MHSKSSTRAEAIFDVEGSEALSAAEKRRVIERAGPVLRAIAQDERSQLRNRELAADRIVEQLRTANYRPRARRPTKPSKGAREQRLESKHRRAGTKRFAAVRPTTREAPVSRGGHGAPTRAGTSSRPAQGRTRCGSLPPLSAPD